MILKTSQEYLEHPGVNQSRLKLIEEPSLYKYGKSFDAPFFALGSIVDDMMDPTMVLHDKYQIVADSSYPSANIAKIIDSFFESSLPDLYTMSIDTAKPILINLARAENWRDKSGDDNLFNIIKRDGEDYFKIRQRAGNKKLVARNLWNKCELMVKNTKLPHISELIDPKPGVDVLNKVRLTGTYKDFEIKGELDKLRIDHNTKTVNIIDIKTTSDLINFKKSVFTYRYDFQLAFYNMLVNKNRKDLGIDFSYTLKTNYILAIDSLYLNNLPRIFELSPVEAMITHKNANITYIGVYEAFDRLEFHTKNNLWDYPMQFYTHGNKLPISIYG